MRASSNLRRAETAQTQALRLTPSAGRREAALTTLSNAASVCLSAALRTDPVASLALADLQLEGPVNPAPRDAAQASLDAKLERFAYGDSQGQIFIHRQSDGALLQQFHAHEPGAGTRQEVRSVGFSPDGSKLVVRFDGGALVVWELSGPRAILKSWMMAVLLPTKLCVPPRPPRLCVEIWPVSTAWFRLN